MNGNAFAIIYILHVFSGLFENYVQNCSVIEIYDI